MNERKSIKVTSVIVERDLYGAVSKRDIHGENSNLLHFSYIAKRAFIITSLFHRFNNMIVLKCVLLEAKAQLHFIGSQQRKSAVTSSKTV